MTSSVVVMGVNTNALITTPKHFGEQTLNALSVSETNTIIADALMASLPGHIRVEGEVSNLSLAASGHRYLSLKDANSNISCALFKNSATRIDSNVLRQLRNGDKVIVRASLSVFKPRGTYQLIINDIKPAGFGALAKAFVALKEKLDKAGITATAHKKPLPFWPRSVAIVTSDTGAAIRDVITTIQRRAPFLSLSVYPTPVQGKGSAEKIITALTLANQDTKNEVIVLVRGGGSLEDLYAFNDEALANAVFNSRLPVVTGVGHETDFTIVDYVSDYRAATPTAAAEAVSPDKKTLLQHVENYQRRLQQAVSAHHQQAQKRSEQGALRLQRQHPLRQVEQQNQRLDDLSMRLFRQTSQQHQLCKTHLQRNAHRLSLQNPEHTLKRLRQQLNEHNKQIHLRLTQKITNEKNSLKRQQKRLSEIRQYVDNCQKNLKGLQARLTLLSPLGILDRGYAVVFDGQNKVIDNIANVKENEPLLIRLANGTLEVLVKARSPNDNTQGVKDV